MEFKANIFLNIRNAHQNIFNDAFTIFIVAFLWNKIEDSNKDQMIEFAFFSILVYKIMNKE